MKTIKVSDKAQQELKIFAAKNSVNMAYVASEAIFMYIKHVKEQSKKPK